MYACFRLGRWFSCFAMLSILQTLGPVLADDDRFGEENVLREVMRMPAEPPESDMLPLGEPFEGPGPPGLPRIVLLGRYLTRTSKAVLLGHNEEIIVAKPGESRTVVFADGSSISFQVTEVSRERVRLQFIGARSMVLH